MSKNKLIDLDQFKELKTVEFDFVFKYFLDKQEHGVVTPFGIAFEYSGHKELEDVLMDYQNKFKTDVSSVIKDSELVGNIEIVLNLIKLLYPNYIEINDNFLNIDELNIYHDWLKIAMCPKEDGLQHLKHIVQVIKEDISQNVIKQDGAEHQALRIMYKFYKEKLRSRNLILDQNTSFIEYKDLATTLDFNFELGLFYISNASGMIFENDVLITSDEVSFIKNNQLGEPGLIRKYISKLSNQFPRIVGSS